VINAHIPRQQSPNRPLSRDFAATSALRSSAVEGFGDAHDGECLLRIGLLNLGIDDGIGTRIAKLSWRVVSFCRSVGESP